MLGRVGAKLTGLGPVPCECLIDLEGSVSGGSEELELLSPLGPDPGLYFSRFGF